MTKLHLAPGLELPIDVVTQKLAFLGRTGSGKTYGATKLAELMLEHDAQIVALDPVGVWYGLRIGGEFKIPVFGGLHGDIVLESTAGAVLADLIVDRGISAVLDVSQFETDTQKARFAEAFATRFFFRKKAAPSAVQLFLEECQEFVPQNPQGGDAQMLHAFTRLAKLGRNFGIGVSLISQRPQEVNKKVLNMTEVMFAFQMRGPQERKTIKDWSSDKALEVDIVDELPSLAVGEAFVSSPQWLQVEKRVKIAKKVTADVSSTPKVGATSTAAARELTPIDLAQLQKTMAATIEKAKAEDPKELQKRIRALEAELKGKGKGPAPAAPDPAALQAKIDRTVAAAVNAERHARASAVNMLFRNVRSITKHLEDALGAMGGIEAINFGGSDVTPASAAAPPVSHASRVAAPAVSVPTRNTGAPARSHTDVVHSNGKLAGARLKIVRGLAELEAIGVGQAKKQQLSFYCGLSFAGGYGSNTLGAMRTEGLVDYPANGYVSLTDAGRHAAGEIDAPTSLEELHNRVRRHLSGLEERIFDALIDVGPDSSITKTELGEKVGASFAGGYGSNTLGALRTAGLVDYPTPGSVRPSYLLFPEGLR